MRTERILFSCWRRGDTQLAEKLWGDPDVTRYICASGRFTRAEILARLALEADNLERYGIQYWPLFTADTGMLIGCCGLRPRSEGCFEIGFHLLPGFWGKGYAAEAAQAVIGYAFSVWKPEGLFAGHHPENTRSAVVLRKLGFVRTGEEYYAPTGLFHPCCLLKAPPCG